jgi:hypothetical protein
LRFNLDISGRRSDEEIMKGWFFLLFNKFVL